MDNLIGLVGYTAFVGYHHDGHSLFLVQFFQQVHHFHARFGVKGSGRLIGKEELDKALDPKEMLQSHKFTLK